MTATTREPRAGLRLLPFAALLIALPWTMAAQAVSVPELQVSVDGALLVPLAGDQVCDGDPAVTCLGTSAVGDLLISSFELTAAPDPYVTGAFNFYNQGANTITVVAEILYPLVGAYALPTLNLGTGIVNNVIGGGILNLVVEGLVDDVPVITINEIAPGQPFSVCDDLGADLFCQNAVTSLSASQAGPALLTVLSRLTLRMTFNLTTDTSATIGFDPSGDFAGAAYFSVVPAVPVPAAAWLFVSGLGVLAGVRRSRYNRSGDR